MNPPRKSRFYLGHRAAWNGRRDRTSASRAGALRLRHAPRGPLSVDSADESLGGLVLPPGLALDEEYRLFLLKSDGRVAAFEGTRAGDDGPFLDVLRLPEGWRGTGRDEARPNIAVVGGRLFAWHAGRRQLLAFDLADADETEPAIVADFTGDDRPALGIDIASAVGQLFVLSTADGAVWRIDPRTGRTVAIPLRGAPEDGSLAGDGPRWSRIAVDRHGGIVLLVPPRAVEGGTGRPAHAGGLLEIFSPDGEFVRRTDDPNELRHDFEGPWIRLDERQCFLVPDFLWRPFRRRPDPGKYPLFADDPHCKDEGAAVAVARAWPKGRPAKVLFDRDGATVPFDSTRPRKQLLYSTAGTWISERLDSRIYRCPWGRVQIELRNMPAGTRVRIFTYTTDSPNVSDPGPRDTLWAECLVITRADLDRFYEPHEWPRTLDALVGGPQRLEGRYLWLRIDLEGDGYRSAAVRSVTLAFPHDSYSQYLPAIYSARRESRVLLERFLAIPQADWDVLEERVDRVPDMLDPARVPDGPQLDFLASWIGAPVELGRTPARRRRLMNATRRTLDRRGTPAGLRALVAALVRPDAVDADDPDDGQHPVIVEGYQDRDLVVLGAEGSHELGTRARVSPRVPDDALVVGVTSRVDEARLMTDEGPEAQLFGGYAHRFDVYVPEAWLRSVEDRDRLRTLLEKEKPAHTTCDVRAVRPGVRIGFQSRVGVDTILGGAPRTQLADGEGDGESGVRLGTNTFLAPETRYPHAFPAIRSEEPR